MIWNSNVRGVLQREHGGMSVLVLGWFVSLAQRMASLVQAAAAASSSSSVDVLRVAYLCAYPVVVDYWSSLARTAIHGDAYIRLPQHLIWMKANPLLES